MRRIEKRLPRALEHPVPEVNADTPAYVIRGWDDHSGTPPSDSRRRTLVLVADWWSSAANFSARPWNGGHGRSGGTLRSDQKAGP
jgi:hypothetical protein